MMDQQRRKELVRLAREQRLRFRGEGCSIGGWRNEYASIGSNLGGFWGIGWEDLEKVVSGESTLDDEFVWFVSGALLPSVRVV